MERGIVPAIDPARAVEVLPEGKTVVWFKFPAPSNNVQTINLVIPNVLPFEELTLSQWIDDALVVLDTLAKGPQVIVGSSMGAWVMLHLALARPDRVVGLVGVAAAPDFTEDMMWGTADDEARTYLLEHKIWRQPSPNGENETAITLALIEDGRKHLVLRDPIPLEVPVRLIHGTDDRSVPWQTSERLMEQLVSKDVTLSLVKGGQHRLSKPEDIELLIGTVGRLLAQLDTG